jgi:hypothetical protein
MRLRRSDRSFRAAHLFDGFSANLTTKWTRRRKSVQLRKVEESGFMLSYWVILAAAVLALGAAPAAHARDKDGFLEPAENPVLGTWLLSEERINPNMRLRCANLTLTITQSPRTFMLIRPNQVAAGRAIFTIIDHDHIFIDEIPGCLYQRGPLNGTTPLLDQIRAEADAQRQHAAEPPGPPPHTTTPEEAQIAIECMNNPSAPGCLTYDQAIKKIQELKDTEPAPAAVISPELQRSMDQLNRAIRDLQEQARQQTGR